MSEVWKDIVDWEGFYQVSNLGRVRSLDRMKGHSSGGLQKLFGRVLKPNITPTGYATVDLCRNNKISKKTIHRLVAKAFIPKPKPTVNHKNSIRDDNRVENLEWMTQSENIQHAHDNGRMADLRGEKHGMSKLNWAQVEVIRRDSRTHRAIAEEYGVDKTTIGYIKSNKTWKI